MLWIIQRSLFLSKTITTPYKVARTQSKWAKQKWQRWHMRAIHTIRRLITTYLNLSLIEAIICLDLNKKDNVSKSKTNNKLHNLEKMKPPLIKKEKIQLCSSKTMESSQMNQSQLTKMKYKLKHQLDKTLFLIKEQGQICRRKSRSLTLMRLMPNWLIIV